MEQKLNKYKPSTFMGDKVQEAINRIRLLESDALRNNPRGFVVCDSGGKASSVIKEIAKLSGVKYEIVHHITTMEPPATMKFLYSEKERHQEVGISYSMEKKDGDHLDRFSVLGFRKSESERCRNSHSAFEFGTYNKDLQCVETLAEAQDITIWHCFKDGRVKVNPIIDWSDSDIFEFIKNYHVPIDPLYEQ